MSIHIEKTKPPSVFFNKWIFSGRFVRFCADIRLKKPFFCAQKSHPRDVGGFFDFV